MVLLVAQALILAAPKILETAVDGTELGAPATVVTLLTAYGVALALGRGLGEASDFLLLRPVNAVTNRIRARVTEALALTPSPSAQAGHILAIWKRSDEAFENILNAMIFQTIPKLFTLLAVASIVSFSYGVVVLIPAALGAVVYAIWLKWAMTKVNKAIRNSNEADATLTNELTTLFRAYRQFLIFGLNPRHLTKTRRISSDDLNARLELMRSQSLWSGGNGVIISVTVATTLIIGYIHAQQAAGGLIALALYTMMVFGPVDDLSGSLRTIMLESERAKEAVDTIQEYRPVNTKADRQWSNIEIKELSPLLEDGTEPLPPINLRLAKNEKMIVTAASGVGKSVFAEAIFFGRPYKGSITVHKDNGSTETVTSLRHLSAYLTQESEMIDRSINDNISLNTPIKNATSAEADKILAGGNILSRINEDPAQGTNIESTLSGGQQRRVALARLLNHRPQLAILDEPLTGLDPTAAQSILDQLLMLTDTTLVILLHNPPITSKPFTHVNLTTPLRP